jgi:2-succinyl-6-hydroxy-2,4-cyclohexadiene-1-carboxylate synthase
MRRVLLHGFTGGPRSFGEVGALVPDLPGHGPLPPATGWDDALAALERLLDAGPTILGGYSMGARLALALALRRPWRVVRLVLESGSAGIEDDRERAARRSGDEELAQLLEREGVAAFLRVWEANPILAGQPHEALRPERMRHTAAGLASALRHLGQGAQPSLWHELPLLRVPVLLVAGALDAKYVALARRMQALLPRAELHLVEGAGHAPHLSGFSWRTA